MKNEDFDEEYYMKMLRTADQVGMQVIPLEDCAKLCAILYVFSAEEVLTHCPKLRCDVAFIKEKYHVDGGETPNAEFVERFQYYARPMDEEYWKSNTFKTPTWVSELMKRRYGIQL